MSVFSESTQICVTCVLGRSPLCHSLSPAFSFCYPLLMKVFNRHSLLDASAGSGPCDSAVDAKGTSSWGQDAALHPRAWPSTMYKVSQLPMRRAFFFSLSAPSCLKVMEGGGEKKNKNKNKKQFFRYRTIPVPMRK